MTTVEILAIGDELLIGRTVNTNATWLGRQLTEAGLDVRRVTTLADGLAPLHRALDRALAEHDVVICTGGLGPTSDDYTMEALAAYAGVGLQLHSPAEEQLKAFLIQRGRTYTVGHSKMVTLPAGAEPLLNPVGAAPGLRMELKGKPVFALPGVPHEMTALTEEYVLPWLQAHLPLAEVRYENWRVVAAESEVAALVKDLEDNFPAGIGLAYNPGIGMLDLRLGLRTGVPGSLDADFDRIAAELDRRVQPWCFARGLTTLSEAVGYLLRDRGATIAVAESCTAGTIARTLAETAGSSAWYVGGALTYSNELKTKLLGVSPELLHAEGAVSREVAIAMAEGAARLCDTQYAISSTGIAGPGGGSEDKPVGTVWVGLHTPQGTTAHHFLFERDRLRNMQRTSIAALWLLYKALR